MALSRALLRALLAALPVFLGHCARQSPTPAPQSPATAPATADPAATAESFERAVAPAREAHDHVLTLRGPRYPGGGGENETLAFLRTHIRPWLREGRLSIEQAEDAYQRALPLAQRPEQQLTMFADVAEMRIFFAREALLSGLSAAPPEVLRDPELAFAYRRAVEDGTEVERDEADKNLRLCQQTLARSHLPREQGKRCDALRRDLEQLTQKRAGTPAALP